jgi:hypothetical protein
MSKLNTVAKDGLLTLPDGFTIPLDSPEWHQWLANNRTFRSGSFNPQLEKIPECFQQTRSVHMWSTNVIGFVIKHLSRSLLLSV